MKWIVGRTVLELGEERDERRAVGVEFVATGHDADEVRKEYVLDLRLRHGDRTRRNLRVQSDDRYTAEREEDYPSHGSKVRNISDDLQGELLVAGCDIVPEWYRIDPFDWVSQVSATAARDSPR